MFDPCFGKSEAIRVKGGLDFIDTELSLHLSVPACGLYPALPGPREEEEEEETEEEEEEDAHQFCCPASECSSPSSR